MSDFEWPTYTLVANRKKSSSSLVVSQPARAAFWQRSIMMLSFSRRYLIVCDGLCGREHRRLLEEVGL